MAASYDPELIDNFEGRDQKRNSLGTPGLLFGILERSLYKASSCLQSREFRNSVIFHGALHGNDKCRINRRHAVEDGDLYDIYEAFVGYDDLYSYVDDQ